MNLAIACRQSITPAFWRYLSVFCVRDSGVSLWQLLFQTGFAADFGGGEFSFEADLMTLNSPLASRQASLTWSSSAIPCCRN